MLGPTSPPHPRFGHGFFAGAVIGGVILCYPTSFFLYSCEIVEVGMYVDMYV